MEILSNELRLVLEDLSRRLPYGVLVQTPSGSGHLNGITASLFDWTLKVAVNSLNCSSHSLENCKPILRKRSSMTPEEKYTYNSLCRFRRLPQYRDTISDVEAVYDDTRQSINYLYSIFVDVEDLISQGLAIEDTNNLYNIIDE